MPIERLGSGSSWEDAVGYSRLVRAGDHVHVAGCTATDEHGALVGVGDPFAQAEQTLRNIVAALARVGATPADVVRTRLYVTDVEQWEAFGRAHAVVFGDNRPVTAMVEVSRLVDPRMLIEIEAHAYLGD